MVAFVNQETALSVFEGKKVRKIWHKDERWFSVTDLVLLLTDSVDELAYWRKLKEREPQLVTNYHTFKLTGKDNKMREADCTNVEEKIGKQITTKENYLNLKKSANRSQQKTVPNNKTK
jgi:prophage antirepressor-like protein